MSRQESSSSSTAAPTRERRLTPGEKDAVKRKATEELKQSLPRRQSPRLTANYDTTQGLTLRFAPSMYRGVSGQKLDSAQSIYFEQAATLAMPAGCAPNYIRHYYEFRQFVRDSWTFHSGATQELGEFVLDTPYRPPYSNPQCAAGNWAISFNDEPGFSTDRKVAAGQWLVDYEVRFQWQVTALYGDGSVWTSPEVIHRVTSPFVAEGGPVAATPADEIDFEVDLPERPRDW